MAQSRFLALPLEMRSFIYAQVFDNLTLKGKVFGPPSTFPLALSILLTNRQVNTESTSYFWKHATFAIGDDFITPLENVRYCQALLDPFGSGMLVPDMPRGFFESLGWINSLVRPQAGFKNMHRLAGTDVLARLLLESSLTQGHYFPNLEFLRINIHAHWPAGLMLKQGDSEFRRQAIDRFVRWRPQLQQWIVRARARPFGVTFDIASYQRCQGQDQDSEVFRVAVKDGEWTMANAQRGTIEEWLRDFKFVMGSGCKGEPR